MLEAVIHSWIDYFANWAYKNLAGLVKITSLEARRTCASKSFLRRLHRNVSAMQGQGQIILSCSRAPRSWAAHDLCKEPFVKHVLIGTCITLDSFSFLVIGGTLVNGIEEFTRTWAINLLIRRATNGPLNKAWLCIYCIEMYCSSFRFTIILKFCTFLQWSFMTAVW